MTDKQEFQLKDAITKAASEVLRTGENQYEVIRRIWKRLRLPEDIYEQLAQEGFQRRLSMSLHEGSGWNTVSLTGSAVRSNREWKEIPLSILDQECYPVDGSKTIPLAKFTFDDCVATAEKLNHQADGLKRKASALEFGAKLLKEHSAKTIGELPKAAKEQFVNSWVRVNISVSGQQMLAKQLEA